MKPKHAAMKFEELKQRFEAKNPGGACLRFTDGSIGVRFKEGGRLYTYSAWPIYRLAEKFDLIKVVLHTEDAYAQGLGWWNEIVRPQ